MNVNKSITITLNIEDIEQALVEYLRKAGYHEGNGYNYNKEDIRFNIAVGCKEPNLNTSELEAKLCGANISTEVEIDGPLKPTTR